MARHKLAQFAENETFAHMFYRSYEELQKGFFLKGKWKQDYFKNDYPITLELGCGKGEYTVGMAKKYPKRNFIGIDLKGARLWHGAKIVQQEGLKNVAFIRTKIDQLFSFFDANEVAEIWLTFSDPQPKIERRRLSSPRFLNIYREILVPNGIIHQKTDNRDLFDYTLEVVRHFDFQLDYFSYDIYRDRKNGDAVEIQTFYEKMFLKEGIPINYMEFRLNEKFADNELLVLPQKIDVKKQEHSFFEAVWEVVALIPPGKVTSYGAIAQYLSTPKAARMVGWAMNASHAAKINIPAHRVVNRLGVLSGKSHFGQIDLMENLLQNEGLIIRDDKIVNFEQNFWDPSKELI